jgi:hypothetical protein
MDAIERKQGEKALKEFTEIIRQRAMAQLMGFPAIKHLNKNYEGDMWRALCYMFLTYSDEETLERQLRLQKEMLKEDKDSGFAREVQADLKRQSEHFSKYPMDEPCITPGCCGNPEEVEA